VKTDKEVFQNETGNDPIRNGWSHSCGTAGTFGFLGGAYHPGIAEGVNTDREVFQNER
jgi:hypothetical protein